MTKSHSNYMLVILQIYLAIAVLSSECATTENATCEVTARTDAGWLCGVRRIYNNHTFASFLNVPYSRQPVGSLRFKELLPAESWEGYYDATTPGPICPQSDVLYGSLMTNTNSSEACIHANIYVPIQALASNGTTNCTSNSTGLPIVVFMHGGAFTSGSGDPDVNGPEYLITEDIIVITFNYRINVFGFLSIPPSIPGNNGLRDAVTLLKWVQVNAQNFGGNPDNVTLAGQSAGAAGVHLLTLSAAAEGLFQRAIMMSGTGIRGFFTASPTFANTTSQLLLSNLGINVTDSEEVHQQLIALPLETIMNASYQVQASYGPTYFTPVIETQNENFTTIIEKDPEVLLNNGQGKDIPLIIGFANLEGNFVIPFYTESNILATVESNPLAILSPDLSYRLSSDMALIVANETVNRCFNGTPTIEKYAKCFADNAIVYPSIKISQMRASMNSSASVYLYQFSYNSSCSPIKISKNITYDGATHLDDLTFFFRTNSMENETCFESPTASETEMREQMALYIKNFISCNDPTCSTSNSSTWPAETTEVPAKYEDIVEPSNIYYTNISDALADTVQYFDAIYNEVYNATS